MLMFGKNVPLLHAHWKECLLSCAVGIPPTLRGQAWQVLTKRYAAKYGLLYQRCPSDAEFTSDLLQQLLEEPSELDHIIKADICTWKLVTLPCQ